MTPGKHDAAVHLDASSESSETSRKLRQWWSVVTTLLVIAIFAQAVFAGAMLSGLDWGRAAHSMTAVALIASTLTAGLVSAATLRRISRGPRLAVTLLSLAVVIFLQTAVGKFAADGANLMWLHVPLGVALLGFAGQAAAAARKLGEA